MGNIFDSLQTGVFDTLAATMGYSAAWTPSTGGATQTAQVLYRGPTEKEKLANVEYNPEELKMEYKFGDFNGLKENVDNGTGRGERVFITTDAFVLRCKVGSVNRMPDNLTMEAHLDIIEIV